MLTALERAEPHVLLALRDVIDLECRVVEVEPLLEQRLEAPPRVVAIGPGCDERVRGGIRLDLRRRGLEEDAAGLAQQEPARANHQRSDEQTRDRVEAAPPG